jgi:hypothetical protein
MTDKNNNKKRIVRKILRYSNHTTLLSVGRLIPLGWKYVIIEKEEETEDSVRIKLTRVKELNGIVP